MGSRQRWRRFKDRLRFKGVTWCGSPWARSRSAHHRSQPPYDASTASSQEDAAYAAAADRGWPRYRREAAAAARHRRESDQDFGCILDQAPAGDAVSAIDEEEEEEMNLAMALAAERQLRAAEREMTMTPFSERSSLMRLMKDGEEEKKREEEEGMEEGTEWWGCCVCMGRRKGAAFIPCGHTFCRVCARELWMTRGSCPLCNQLILETLDIY
ncbi:polycomb group RING finger protein 6 [Cocos nucifera]|uniref:Polycomb group RING finger protein 6 n=1 Tax=Cocos nucifera TaxID=13894 RepID=A0A8K0MV85_COCNU|nr:polycomb group RING finger protein 6 [Cocos nucifera]